MKAITVIVKALLAVAAVCLVVAVGWMFLPAGVRNAITIFSLANAKTAIITVTLILFVAYVIRLLKNLGTSRE
ncbi:hypothetical protein L0Z10_29940 [Burkholderia multivorans]|uniref:hypothetical protein n=1 Tax=Burkholderia multivorans TaxID=87883 RepID=UPI00207D3648|nr:hypothetical protein [Burkholderia multivorans]MCO1459954.1 hypothetical protein [Burkholderia multivorans]